MNPNVLGRNLTELAKAGQLEPAVGREQEELEILRVLCRRTKSNPLLVGQPGVGKTVLAESIAQRISQGDVPLSLRNRVLYEIRLGDLLAGTKYRGDLEQRLKELLLAATKDRMILFIDEIHTLSSAGKGAGLDVANLLKPFLARGEVPIIGATTPAEGEFFLSEDPAMERRFQKVEIPAPNEEQTLQMLKAVRPKLEKHHGLQISDDALSAAIALSIAQPKGRSNPDRSIDILEDACAREQLAIASEVSREVRSDHKLKELQEKLEGARRALDLNSHLAVRLQIDEHLRATGSTKDLELRSTRKVTAALIA